MTDIVKGSDGRRRCGWCGDDALMSQYHDREWGRPVWEDRQQFEFLVLESAQAGLSWITVLRKREAYREAYAGFNPALIARWGEPDVLRLMDNPGIIRNRRKIESSIGNAVAFLEISARCGSFANWLLDFFDGQPLNNHWNSLSQIPAITERATLIAGELKKMGFRFMGPTIVYAHLQATGLVNDHLDACEFSSLPNQPET